MLRRAGGGSTPSTTAAPAIPLDAPDYLERAVSESVAHAPRLLDRFVCGTVGDVGAVFRRVQEASSGPSKVCGYVFKDVSGSPR